MTFENLSLELIFRQFQTDSDFLTAGHLTTGHINDSFHIRCNGENNPGFFLQKINTGIFKDVDGLMTNICAVSEHLASKLEQNKNLRFRVLEVIPCIDGKPYFREQNSNCWRLYKFIADMHSHDLVSTPKIAFEGGKAFGIFMSLLADMPANKLTETIPDFHHMGKRLQAFENAVNQNPASRVVDVPEEIEFVRNRASEMMHITGMIALGEIPMRITHNDTKFNNILFDNTENAICIVDLDTVMPGSVLFDFGDAIRTGANTALEDEQDLSKVGVNMPIFEAYTEGFLKSTFQALTPAEVHNLAFAARYMTFIIGLRFLTDFLNGDIYFRTAYPSHNLVRSRVQFRLVEKMEENSQTMQNIVNTAFNKYNQQL